MRHFSSLPVLFSSSTFIPCDLVDLATASARRLSKPHCRGHIARDRDYIRLHTVMNFISDTLLAQGGSAQSFRSTKAASTHELDARDTK